MLAVQETAAQVTDQIGKALIVAGFAVAMITTMQAVALLGWL